MKRERLLLAEGNADFAMVLQDALKEHFFVQTCTDAWVIKSIACRYPPDVLVLDVLLPGMDTERLLHFLAGAGLNPRVMATTYAMDPELLEPLDAYGVGYVMLKPCSLRRAVEHIRELDCRLHPRIPVAVDHRSKISALLQELRIPVKSQGYFYLVETIARAVDNPDMSFCKELYPDVARLRNVQWTSVERCIRSAINAGWKVRDEELWQEYFPAEFWYEQKKPTNAEFICRISQCIREMAQREYRGRF